MKRLLALLITLTLLLGCAAAETAAEPEAAPPQVTTKVFPVYAFSVEETWREDFPLYFLDGVEDIPFVNLEDWKEVLVFIYNQLSAGEKTYTLDFEVLEEGKKVRLTRESGFPLVIDFEKGQMIFQDYVAFVQQANSQYMEINGFPETQNGQPYLLQRTTDRSLYGDVTVVDLKEYNIPMAVQDGKYLLPMQTLSAFTLVDSTIGIYYNGEAMFISMISSMTSPKIALQTTLALYGLLTMDLIQKAMAVQGTSEEQFEYLLELVSEESEKGKEIVEDYKKGLDTNLYVKYDSVPKTARSEALIKYGFYELALELNCFYGLKESHNIKDFRLFFLQNEVGNGLADPDASKADQAVATLLEYWFDDSHSGFIGSSYLSESNVAQNFGLSVTAKSNFTTMMSTIRAQYPNATQPYYEVGDTAFVTFDNFVASTDKKGPADYYKLAEEGSMPADTVGIIYNAHKQITRENSPIKKVVLDLSANGGGMAPAAFFTLGWFLGEANYSYRNTFTNAQTTHNFRVDVNLDHQFDENDTLAGRGIKLYCLISPTSFSCGNLVPWVFKESSMVTLLGRTSGGGSCVVGYNTTAWGSSYQYSSSKQLSFTKNGSYYNVDQGVEPDFIIDDFTHFYDREALAEFINGLY